MRIPRSRHYAPFCGLLISLCAIVVPSTTGYAQPHSEPPEPGGRALAFGHQAWSNENGLPQNSVHQILQTRDGYLWIATEGGVARFNGVQFAAFNHDSNPAFTSNDACCLAEDRSGSLWIGTADGLLQYAGGTFRRYAVTDGLPSAVVVSLAPTDDGLLVLTTEGLARYDGHQFTQENLSPSAIGQGPNGSALIATQAAISLYSQNRLRSLQLPGLPTEPIEGLGSLQDGSWARTRTALLIWNQGHLRSWQIGRELPGTRVQSFLADSRGNLWVGTDQGIVLLSTAGKNDEVKLRVEPALGATSVLTIFEDHEHNLWVGTDTAGLHILRQQRFQTVPSLLGYTITAVTQTADGAIWLGSKGEGLFRYERGQTFHFSTRDGLLSDVILALAADRDGSLWIGTPDGLNHLNNGKISSFTSSDGLPDDFIRSLFSDTDGTLWVGTRRGLAHWSNSRWTVLSLKDGLKSNLVGAMLRSHSNDLWVGTFDGLTLIRDGKLTTFTKANGLSSNVITSLLEDKNNVLWIGTKDGGLNRSSNSAFSPVQAQHLPSDIEAMLEDPHGYMWLSSDHGIVRARSSDLTICDASCDPRIAIYGSSDGMPSEETSSSGHPGAWKTTDGQLWFATRKGVAVANPTERFDAHAPPPVMIERFTVDDTVWTPAGQETKITPGHVRYAFEYAALSYFAPSKVRYRYILEGFDKQWTQAGSRRNAYYTNLPPRHYRFRVQATNEAGTWSDSGAELSFIVQPPFYRTFWFLALSTVLFAGIIFAAYRMRVRAIRSQFDAVLAERNRIAREIHDTLAQGFVGVSVQLELTAHLLAQSQVLEASQQVDRTRDLVREGLADARRSIWDLRASGAQATLPARLTHLAEQNKSNQLKVNVTIGGTYRALAASFENEVLRVAQEALTNVVRHSGATRAELNLRYHPTELTLKIADNGTGFQATDAALLEQGHFGIQGMRERAVQIGGTLNIESSDGGTTVTLCTPLQSGKE